MFEVRMYDHQWMFLGGFRKVTMTNPVDMFMGDHNKFRWPLVPPKKIRRVKGSFAAGQPAFLMYSLVGNRK